MHTGLKHKSSAVRNPPKSPTFSGHPSSFVHTRPRSRWLQSDHGFSFRSSPDSSIPDSCVPVSHSMVPRTRRILGPRRQPRTVSGGLKVCVYVESMPRSESPTNQTWVRQGSSPLGIGYEVSSRTRRMSSHRCRKDRQSRTRSDMPGRQLYQHTDDTPGPSDTDLRRSIGLLRSTNTVRHVLLPSNPILTDWTHPFVRTPDSDRPRH